MKKISKLIFASIIATSVLLSSCTSDEKNTQSSKEATKSNSNGGEKKISGTIRVFTWGFPAEKIAREEQVKLFMEEYPDITVELEVSPEYDRKLAAMIASGDAPDVFETSDDWFHIRANDVEDLNPYIERDNLDLSVYYPRTIEGFVDNTGKRESLPIGLAPFALAVNKDLLTEAGIDLPGNDLTWDEVIDLSTKVTKGVGVEKIYGIADSWMWDKIMPFYKGGEIFEYDFSDILLDSEKSIDGLEFYRDLMFKHEIMPSSKDGSGMSGSERFFAGKVLFCPINMWDVVNFQSTIDGKFEWGIVKMPLMEDSNVSVTWGITEGYSISNTSQNKEAAWEFIKWTTTDKESLKLASIAAIPPTFESRDDFLQKDFGKQKLDLQVFLDSVEITAESPGGPFSEMSDIMGDFYTKLKAGETSQDDLTSEVKALADKLRPMLKELDIKR